MRTQLQLIYEQDCHRSREALELILEKGLPVMIFPMNEAYRTEHEISDGPIVMTEEGHLVGGLAELKEALAER